MAHHAVLQNDYVYDGELIVWLGLTLTGKDAGLELGQVAAPPRDRLVQKSGICEVNSHAEGLGFAIVGWVRLRHQLSCTEGNLSKYMLLLLYVRRT